MTLGGRFAILPPVLRATPLSEGGFSIAQLGILGCAFRRQTGFRTLGHRRKLFARMRPEQEVSVKGVKPGELYSVGLSMKRRGPGFVYINARFRGDGKPVNSKENIPAIAMSEPRAQEDVWRSGEVVVPENIVDTVHVPC